MAQGYEEPRTIVRLAFTDPTFEGLVVRAYAAPTDVLEDVSQLSFIDATKAPDAATLAKIRGIIKRFGDELVSWNLTRNGVERPATLAAVRKLDLVFAWQLVAGWVIATQRLLSGNLQALQVQQDAAGLDETELPMELPD